MSILNSNMHVTTVSTQGSDQSKPAVKPQPSVASSFAECSDKQYLNSTS